MAIQKSIKSQNFDHLKNRNQSKFYFEIWREITPQANSGADRFGDMITAEYYRRNGINFAVLDVTFNCSVTVAVT